MTKSNDATADKTRVIVVGLDGATWTLLKPWVDEGRLPTLQSLMERGRWGFLESSNPYISPTAWASFLTGKNPGKHRIVDFSLPVQADSSPDKGSLERIPANAREVRGGIVVESSESGWKDIYRC